VYDVVWYTPNRSDDAARVLKRLTLDEVNERECPDLLMGQAGVPIPSQKVKGRCVCRNFMGAVDCMHLGATDHIASLCSISDHGEGLVGGILLPSFWLSDVLKGAEQSAEERESSLRASKPLTARQLLKCSIASLSSFVVFGIASIIAIPRSFRKEPKRKIRTLAELENEGARLFGAIARGIQ
jgi:hypothetical protein